jgi:hypothetical protein
VPAAELGAGEALVEGWARDGDVGHGVHLATGPRRFNSQ